MKIPVQFEVGAMGNVKVEKSKLNMLEFHRFSLISLQTNLSELICHSSYFFYAVSE